MIPMLLVIFFVLLGFGLPIVFTLGITSLVMIALFSPTPLLMIPEVMYNSLDSFPLMAIPLFVIAAQFMLEGGASKYLINAVNCYVRHMRGGLAIVAVISCAIFAAISGSSVATALSMGVIVIPGMMVAGYSRRFAAGVVAASGTMGIMIPPSIALILYGIIVEESIPRLFLAGIAPGLLEVALYIAWIVIYSRKMDFRGGNKATVKEAFQATVKAIPAFSMPIIVLGGIYSGIFTVTEAASLAAVAAIIIAVFVYREVSPRRIFAITADAMKSAAMIMFIISTAIVFGNWITEAGIPARVVNFVSEMHLSPIVFLIFVNLLLLFLGMFLEVVSIMLITLPVLLPILTYLGIDLVHFGVIMTVNMELALETPPVGLNLYVISGVARAPLSEVIRGTYPFTLVGLIQIAVVTYWPQFSLFLPNLLMPK